MNPSQLAQSLKRIASGIEASSKPKKELVIRDLKKIISSMKVATTYVWVSRGDNQREMENLKAVLVEASSIEEAKEKVISDMVSSWDDEEKAEFESEMEESYGNSWFVQELSSEKIP